MTFELLEAPAPATAGTAPFAVGPSPEPCGLYFSFPTKNTAGRSLRAGLGEREEAGIAQTRFLWSWVSLAPVSACFQFSGFLLTFLRFSGLLQKSLLFQKKAKFNNQDIMQEVNFCGFYFPALALVHIMNLGDGG